MKTILLLVICVIAISINAVFAQDEDQPKSKHGQSVLFNDVYLGYGAGGLFYWTGRMAHSSGFPSEQGSQNFTEPSSAGALLLGYSRTLNRVVSMGFLFGFQDFTYTGTTTQGLQTDYNDLLLEGIARVTFCYLNKPAIRMYSGIGIGITMNFGTATQPGKSFTDRKLYPGGQLTLMGIRFGRALGGFVEFGIGTIGIVNAGISYKFAD
jgi:hypothetical protein